MPIRRAGRESSRQIAAVDLGGHIAGKQIGGQADRKAQKGTLVALVIPDVLAEDCATRRALERLATKWRVLLIYALLAGPQRHAELRRRLPGITQKVLTATLREMVADGLAERRVLKATAPQHVEYALTDLGRTLEGPLTAVCEWALAHSGATAATPVAERDTAAPAPAAGEASAPASAGERVSAAAASAGHGR